MIEGVYWVQRSAYVFVGKLRGGVRRARLDGPLGDSTRSFFVLSPLIPLPRAFIVEPLPFWPTKGGVWVGDRFWSAQELQKVSAAGKSVLAGGTPVLTTSSPALAAAIADAISGGTMEAWLARRHDVELARTRIVAWREVTRPLMLLGNVVPVLMLGGVYALFYVDSRLWQLLLGALVPTLLAIWALMLRAHAKLYPKLGADRFTKMAMMLLSFPASARAAAWLARDLLAESDPIAAAIALGAPELIAAEALRNLEYPRLPEPNAQELAEARRAELARAKATLRAAEVDVAALLAAPSVSDPSVRSYCPRCLTEYTEAQGTCADCPAVALLSAKAP